MQTQEISGIKKYTDNEQYSQYRQRCARWYIFYQGEIHQLICHTERKSVVSLNIIATDKVFEKSLSEMKHLLETFEFAQDEFLQTHAVIVEPKYTFVPDALFDPGAAETYLQLIHQKSKFNSVYYEKLQQTVSVYAVSDLFYNAVRLALPGVIFHHYAGFLVQALGVMQDKKQSNRLYVNIQEAGMDVVQLNGNSLTYHNYFPFESDTDVVYFLLSVAEIQNLNSESWEVVVSGNLNTDHSLIGLMKKYIPKVLLLKRPDNVSYPSAFREFQEQHHFIDLSVLLCE